LVTQPITFDYNGAQSIIFRGEASASLITGNFAGYILDRNLASFNPTGGMRIVEKLQITNTNAAGGGIRMGSTVGGAVQDCVLSAFNCLTTADSAFNASQSIVVKNCTFSTLPNAPTGSTGIFSGANIAIFGCDFSGFDNAIRAWGEGLSLVGCRIEVNRIGLMLGMHPDGTTWALDSSLIAGSSLEANDTAIYCNALTASEITSLSIIGSSGSPSRGSLYGVYVPAGAASYDVFNAILAAGGFSNSAFSIGGGCNGVVFSACIGGNGGRVWSMPGDSTVQFVNCNNPSPAFPFGNLPTSAVEGMAYDITDSPTAIWGASVTVGGGTKHVRVRFNGTKWTVMGA